MANLAGGIRSVACALAFAATGCGGDGAEVRIGSMDEFCEDMADVRKNLMDESYAAPSESAIREFADRLRDVRFPEEISEEAATMVDELDSIDGDADAEVTEVESLQTVVAFASSCPG